MDAMTFTFNEIPTIIARLGELHTIERMARGQTLNTADAKLTFGDTQVAFGAGYVADYCQRRKVELVSELKRLGCSYDGGGG
jgi:hypothetical protein